MPQPQTSLLSFQRDFQFKENLIINKILELLSHGLRKISKVHLARMHSIKREFKMLSKVSSKAVKEIIMQAAVWCKLHPSVIPSIKSRPNQSSIWWILLVTSWINQRLKFHQFSLLFLANPNHNAAFSELEATTILHILHSTDNKNRQLQKYLQSQDLQQERWKILHKITDKKRVK